MPASTPPPASPSGDPPLKRPRSLTLAGMLTLVQGAGFSSLFALGMLHLLEIAGFATFVAQMFARPSLTDAVQIALRHVGKVVAIGLLPTWWLIFGLSSLVIGLSLLRMRVWAWLGGLVVEGMILALGLFLYFGGRADAIAYAMMVLAIVIVLFLNQFDTQAFFKQQRRRLEEQMGR